MHRSIGARRILDANGHESPCHIDQSLAAFTRELDPGVSLASWQREDTCDSLLSKGFGWVLTGVIRKYLVHEDGQRRIVDLLMHGDFFFSLSPDETHRFSYAAAIDDTVTGQCSWNRLRAKAETNPFLYQFFFHRVSDSVSRLEEHILVQGRTTATEKVASYLLLISRRLDAGLQSSIVLPISRYDIADHLGIAAETVSRVISELRRSGLITLENPRRLTIKDPMQLEHDVLPEQRKLRG